jgi:heme exporter protein C
MAHTTARRTRRRIRVRRDIGWLAAGLTAAGIGSAAFVAPPDAVQGDYQRLMYLHVPAAWTAYAAFTVVLLAGAGYAIRRDLRFDRYAQAAAEIGVAATIVAIAAGSVWGHAVWGVWWAWDPRLVSTALLLLVYTAQLAVRHLTGNRHRDAARAAAVGIIGFPLVPVTHFSVVWWRSLHQPATVLAPDPSPPIDGMMAATLLLCVAAMTAGAAWLLLHRLDHLEARYDHQDPAANQGTGENPAAARHTVEAPAGRESLTVTGGRR